MTMDVPRESDLKSGRVELCGIEFGNAVCKKPVCANLNIQPPGKAGKLMKRVLTIMMLVGALLSTAMVATRYANAQDESSKKEKKKDSDEEKVKKEKKNDSDEEKAKKKSEDEEASKKSSNDETSKKKSKKTSLYARLGGKKSIQGVVDEFINIVAADARINKFFAAAANDQARLKTLNKNLVDQICEATGGPCKYKGKDMKAAHLGMGVSEADFNALVEDLVKALDKFNVGETEKNEILAALGPMKGDIVEK